jgi:hypothetical protein
MLMKTSFDADKFCNTQGSLNAKKLSYFKVFSGFHVALPNLLPYKKSSLQRFC